MTEEAFVFLNNLLEESPFVLLFVLGFALFYFMHKKDMDVIKGNSEFAVIEIQKAYESAYDRLKNVPRLNG